VTAIKFDKAGVFWQESVHVTHQSEEAIAVWPVAFLADQSADKLVL
jgi:hypothetical protein